MRIPNSMLARFFGLFWLATLAHAPGVQAAKPAANLPPSVSLIAPGNGAVFPAGSNITLTATASDADGTISQVAFYNGNKSLIGTATTAPYTITWNNVPVGNYALKAVATDDKRAKTTSSIVNISVVANLPPTITLTSPSNGSAFLTGSTVMLEASAEDADGAIVQVEFLSGTTSLGVANGAPYSVAWANAASGLHLLTARATDDKGAVTTSAGVSVIIAEPPPVVLVEPVACSVIDGPANIILAADAESLTSGIAKVDFFNDATLLGTATVPPYAIAWSNVPVGSYTITATATDKLGLTGSSRPASLTVRQPNLPPVVSVVSPVSGAVLGLNSPVTLTATASDADGAVSRVDFYVSGTPVGTVLQPPYSASWTPTAPGSYSVTAVATDNLGGTMTSSAVPVTVSTLAVALTTPAAASVFPPPATINLAATASDSQFPVTKVEFYAGATLIGAAVTAPYSLSWTNVPVGLYTLTARATNSQGVTVASPPVAVAVSTLAVALTAPANGANFIGPATIELAAIATDNEAAIAKVEFYNGATLLGTATTAPYGFSWTNVPIGAYTLTARATDALGVVVGSAPVTVSVNPNAPPAVNLSASNSTFYAPASITLTATATDNDGSIAKVDFYNGATLIGTATAAPFTFNWTNVPVGSYSLTARATDNLGLITTSNAVGVTVLATPLAVTSIQDGATVTESSLLVSGTVSAPPNTGITVNGLLALQDGQGHFYANNVPLQAGANTLAVTLTTADGVQYSQALTVNYTPPATAAATLTASPLQGIAPLVTNFTVTAAPGASVQKVDIDFNADGSIDQTINYTPTTTGFNLNFDQPGLYRLRFLVTDSNGVVTEKSLVVQAIDKTQLDTTLKNIWSGLNTDLSAGNRDNALKRFSGPAQAKYGPVFDALQAELPAIVASFSAPIPTSLSNELGEYAVTRTVNGVTQLYLIYYTLDTDGVWRIDGM